MKNHPNYPKTTEIHRNSSKLGVCSIFMTPPRSTSAPSKHARPARVGIPYNSGPDPGYQAAIPGPHGRATEKLLRIMLFHGPVQAPRTYVRTLRTGMHPAYVGPSHPAAPRPRRSRTRVMRTGGASRRSASPGAPHTYVCALHTPRTLPT